MLLTSFLYADYSVAHENGDMFWHHGKTGLLHREDGPAVIRDNGVLEWYIHGRQVGFDSTLWDKRMAIIMRKARGKRIR